MSAGPPAPHDPPPDDELDLLAACERLHKFLAERVDAALQPSRDWRQAVGEVIAEWLALLAAEPEFARQTMVEPMTASPQTHLLCRTALEPLESLLRHGRVVYPESAPPHDTAEDALIGGAAAIVSRRVFRGETDSLVGLSDELTRFVLIPYLEEGRGFNSLPPDFLADHRRRRLIAAMAELVAERGYQATDVKAIAERAGLALGELQGIFADKEQLFLALLDSSLDEALRVVAAACMAVDADDWEGRVRAGLAALLDHIAANPPPAHACLLEAAPASQSARERYEQIIPRFAALLHDCCPPSRGVSEAIEGALVGGTMSVIHGCIQDGEAGRLPELLDQLSECMLVPYRGASSPEDGNDR